MERETRLIFFFVILAALLLMVIIWYVRNARRQTSATGQLKQRYDQAILDGNKRLALQLGREYYSRSRRSGVLTVYDELAIANDLSTTESRRSEN
jgi:hypothetical protein